MLKNYTQPEDFQGYVCGKCHKKSECTKRLIFDQLPPILISTIKRFQYDKLTQDKSKILHKIKYTNELTVENILSGYEHKPFQAEQKDNYTLKGFIVHKVKYLYQPQDLGSEQGHYVAFTKDEESRRWYIKDDTSVEPRDEYLSYEAQADQSTIYIMFYQKDNPVPLDLSEINEVKSKRS